MNDIGYLRQPALRGDTVVFVCDDDLWTVDAAGGVARRLTAGLGEPSTPALSPDGRWLAYQSDESGRNEVYVRSWPGLGNKTQVSQSGGTEPAWSRDGRELFYRSGGGAEPMLVAAAFEGGPDPRIRSRTELFNVASYEFATPHRNYDPFPDGRSFAMVRQGRPGQLAEVVYVQNPAALLDRP